MIIKCNYGQEFWGLPLGVWDFVLHLKSLKMTSRCMSMVVGCRLKTDEAADPRV